MLRGIQGLPAAVRTVRRLDIRCTLIRRQWKELLALSTGTDLEIGGSIRIEICRKEQLVRVVPDCHPVGKLDDGKTIVKNFECGLLSFSLEYVAHHVDWLTFPLCAKIAQRMLGGGGTRELAAGTCSCRRHPDLHTSVNDGNLYHTEKNVVKVGLRS